MRIWTALLVYAAVLVAVCGSDGFLRVGYPHWDSAWFYMGGKAWMEGMTPYADFSDSKGPLLWLIYGVGYLLSPRSFHGLFFIEIIFYWATFCLMFRSARLLTGSDIKALFATFLMGVAYFFPVVHQEMRAEDFCNLFYALTLYSLLKVAKGEEGVGRYGLYMGISVGCALMVKYNIALILGFPAAALVVWYIAEGNGKRLRTLRFLGGWSAGLAVIAVPFVVYFLTMGTMRDFLGEYFLATAGTLGNISDGTEGMSGMAPVLKRYLGGLNLRGAYIALSCLGVAGYLYLRPIRRGFGWLLLAWFAVALVMSLIMPWDYYLFNLAIFWIFMFSAGAERLKFLDFGTDILAGACTAALLSFGSVWFPNAEFHDVERARNYESVIGQLGPLSELHSTRTGKRATIAYANTADKGLHVASGMLPGVKYWALQSGAPEAMISEHITSILTYRPDFVVVREEDRVLTGTLEENGYRKVITFRNSGVRDSGETSYIMEKIGD